MHTDPSPSRSRAWPAWSRPGGGFTPRYDYALQTLKDVQYDQWREYNAEDAVRFWALRMREAGFIKLTPHQIIAEHTDWRFLDELKRELKA